MGILVQKVASTAARILVSEDDPSVRRSLQLLLRSRGFDVRAYTSGNALLLDPQARSGDCLVVDYCMPDIDGIAMLKRLRSTGWSGPAILITAHYADSLAASGREAGFAAVLEKPLGDNILLQTIEQVLSARREVESD